MSIHVVPRWVAAALVLLIACGPACARRSPRVRPERAPLTQPIELVAGAEWAPIIDACGGMGTRILEGRFDGDRLQVIDRSDRRDVSVPPDAVRAVVKDERPERVHWVPRAEGRGYLVLVSHGDFGDWLHLVATDGRVEDTRQNLHASYLASPETGRLGSCCSLASGTTTRS
ncbi:hypothetical protein [Luteitalea pratensis]|uniref:hypothetical protein n=1 Tax=Luteitalea pratensis TaxID=1855912 RepID=UPI0012FF5AFC|nr:hypothetical protein [Luteitalea pratensis]